MKQDACDLVAFVGIDWADKKHDISYCSSKGEKPKYKQIDSSPEALSQWIFGLRQKFPEGYIGVGLEQSRGSLLFHLLGYDFLVIYPINPLSMANYRKTFHPGGSKDDVHDADLIRDLIYNHRDRLRPWVPDDEQSRTLGFLAEARRKAVNDRTRISNRLKSTLKTYFPQALELAGQKLHSKMSIAFLQRWEKLEDIKRAQEKSIRTFYSAHGGRSIPLIEKRLELVRSATPLTKDKAVISSATIAVRMLVRQLTILNEAIEEYEQSLGEIYKKHPDRYIFDSFPGSGSILGPRLTAAWGSDRQRFEKPENMQQLSGIAPVTKKSGKSVVIHRRLACSKYLLQTFHEFAACSLRDSIWAKAFYTMQRERGKSHHTSIRSLAFKWIRIMHRCWRERICYSEIEYIKSLQRTHSPVLSYIAGAAK